MLQNDISTLKVEIDSIKNQTQEKEKKYFEDIEIVKEENDDLQETKKTLINTILQYGEEVHVLKAKNTMLKSELENEKQKTDRLETEVETYRSRLATTIHDQEQGQTSESDLDPAFQRARDESSPLQEKRHLDESYLRDHNQMLSQEVADAETKFNSLETKPHRTRDALREKSLVLEPAQRALSQAQCQQREGLHMYPCEQGRVKKCVDKQKSLEEKLSQLEKENLFLRQQLGDLPNQAGSREEMAVNIQEQCQDAARKLQPENEQLLMLEESNKKLTDERGDHLQKRTHWCERERTEREVSIQKEKDLSDFLKESSE
uniref:CCDC144C-like coiled-coil domain-containing protein n=1 Tax=Catagonus wagneri TaxID=51154 RepID=A0A8C3W1U4_9CETA